MGLLGGSGYLAKTFSELKVLVQNVYKTAYGENINLEEESIQGVTVNKLTDLFNDAEQSGVDIYNGLNIKTATGTMLDNFAYIKGTVRNDGTKAVIDVELTSSSVPYTIPASTVFNILNTDILFWTTASATVASTTQTLELIAKENGLSGISVGDKLSSQAYIATLTDVEITSLTDGTDNEDDEALRERLITTDDIDAQGDVNSVYTGLYNLTDVQKVRVLENRTDTTDENDLPPYSINAIVLGDTTQNIIDILYTKTAGGTPFFGSVTGTYTDIAGYTHDCAFDRPDKVDVWIAASVTAKDAEVAVDGGYDGIIKQNCLDYIEGLKIGRDVSYTSIYGFFANPNTFDIVALEMSRVSSSSGMAASTVTIDVREYANMDSTDNIYIEVL
jgi:uncharacterized phage protein gp47/JayE